MKKKIPNMLTILRAVLIIPIVIFALLDYKYMPGILFLIAGLSDMFDGYLARKWDACSDFGRKADPIIDKFLSIIVLIVIVFKNPINIFLLLTEAILGGMGWIRLKENPDISPLKIGKIKTVFLIPYITLLLFDVLYLPFFYFIIVFESIVIFAYALERVRIIKKKNQKRASSK